MDKNMNDSRVMYLTRDMDYSTVQGVIEALVEVNSERRINLRSIKVKKFLHSQRKRLKRIDQIHSSILKQILRMKRMKNTNRIHLIHRSSSLRKEQFRLRKTMMRLKRRVPTTSTDFKTYYPCGHAIEGYKYGVLLWLQEEQEDYAYDADKFVHYDVTIRFMNELRSGLRFQQYYNGSQREYIDLTGLCIQPSNCTCDNNNNDKVKNYILLPVGLDAIIRCFEIPDSCGQRIIRLMSRFANMAAIINRGDDKRKKVMVCAQIRIATQQLEGEDVLNTVFRCEVNGYYRGEEFLDSYKRESHLLLHIQKYASNEEEEDDCCSICLQDRGCCSYVLPCKHIYHYDCILKWMSRSNCCPLCQQPYLRFFPPHWVYPQRLE